MKTLENREERAIVRVSNGEARRLLGLQITRPDAGGVIAMSSPWHLTTKGKWKRIASKEKRVSIESREWLIHHGAAAARGLRAYDEAKRRQRVIALPEKMIEAIEGMKK